MMKILSLTNSPLDATLGSGKTVLRYTQGLKGLGHQVDIIEPKDFEFIRRLDRARRYRQALGAWFLLKHKIKIEEYDLIEFYGAEFWPLARKISRLSRRPLLVAHTNGLELADAECERSYDPARNAVSAVSRRIYNRLAKSAFISADAFVCMTKIDLDYVLTRGIYPESRAALIRHGVDEAYRLSSFDGQREDRVAFMGTWISRKGVKNLCRVMAQVLKEIPKACFDIYGTGEPQEGILRDFPPEVRNRISVYPKIPDKAIAAGFSKTKIFFFPSQYEGFGLALAEAMSCGCTAVTTPTGFAAELEDEKEAMLCGFNDCARMKDSIIALLNNEEMRAGIARAGGEKVLSMTWDNAVSNLDANYRRWLGEYRNKR